MADVSISYKGNTIADMSASGTKTLLTANSYCENNIVIEYTKPAGMEGLQVYTTTALMEEYSGDNHITYALPTGLQLNDLVSMKAGIINNLSITVDDVLVSFNHFPFTCDNTSGTYDLIGIGVTSGNSADIFVAVGYAGVFTENDMYFEFFKLNDSILDDSGIRVFEADSIDLIIQEQSS